MEVKVILDQNIAYEQKDDLGISVPANRNRNAYKFLKNNGISVFFDDLNVYTHAKCLIIDEKTIILGSANWSESALSKNNEISVLLYSPSLAKELISLFASIKLDKSPRYDDDKKYIPLFLDAMINGLSQCVFHRSNTAWNIYFYLLCHPELKNSPSSEGVDGAARRGSSSSKVLSTGQGATISLPYPSLYPYVYTRNKKPLPPANQRAYIRDALKSLSAKGLIKYQNPKDITSNHIVILANAGIQSSLLSHSLQEGDQGGVSPLIKIPELFFTYGWHNRLSITAQYCYFICLIEGGIENKSWCLSMQTTLPKKYKINRRTLQNGFIELRNWNLIINLNYG